MRASIEELADFVDEYQGGAKDADEHVTDWLARFDEPDTVADELSNVLRANFVTRDQAAREVAGWLSKPKTVSRGLVRTWDEATFLEVAAGGGSQRAVLDLLDEVAAENGEEPIRARRGHVFVYTDDVSVQGMRILNDLTPWMIKEAPEEFELLILLQRRLAGQEMYLANELRNRARRAGKTVRIAWWCNQDFAGSDCYCPAVLPDDDDLAGWMEDVGIKAPKLRTASGTGRSFSSNASREVIESEFLIAGAKVLRNNRNLRRNSKMRPLGNTAWSTSPLGLGVPIVTWRNCPNSAPLVLWAEGIGAPLFPRRSN